MRIAYLENARLPTEKAHGYQIMKTCEALVQAGAEVQLFVADRRNPLASHDVFEYYGVPKLFDVFRFPVLDAMDVIPGANAFAYALERRSFLRSVRRARLALLASDVWYTRDPVVAETLVSLQHARPVFVELHNADDRVAALASRVTGWIAISEGLKRYLIEQGVAEEKITVAHDGFDPDAFAELPSKEDARRTLGIDSNVFLAAYAGHLYPWKGVDAIAPAFSRVPEGVEIAIVGGYPNDIRRVEEKSGNAPHVKFVGHQSRKDVLTWLAAADAAILPTSAQFEIGKSYTSPLKLFEYLAAGLPVIASDVPSAREILDDSVATFFKPDDAEDFLSAVGEQRAESREQRAKSKEQRAESREQRAVAEMAKQKVKPYAWKERGKGIVERLESRIKNQESRRKKGILIVTQAVDEADTNLSFFLDWLRELASRVSVVHVAAWKTGEHRGSGAYRVSGAHNHAPLPGNVYVHAMPKGKLKRIIALKKLTFSVREDVDAVFVHMLAPVAATLGLFWRLMGKRVVLWYTHGSVPLSLRVANVFVNGICTATSPSMNLKTIKKIVTGHGIDTDRFRPSDAPRLAELVTVGRITPRKRLESLIDLVEAVRKAQPSLPFRLRIVGEAYLDSDRAYAETLATEVARRGLRDIVSFDGAKLGDELIELYRRSAAFVTASETGSLDKAVLESLSCGTPVLAASRVFAGFDGVHVAPSGWDEDAVAFVVSRLAHPTTDEQARADVARKASLKTLISRLVSILLD